MSWVTEQAPKEVVQEAKEMIRQNEEKKQNFVFHEAINPAKEIYTIFGEKGVGKTTLALSFPGKIAALCFDNKTGLIKDNIYKSDERIKVYDAIEFLNEEKQFYTESSKTSYNYIVFLLEEIKRVIKPDWIFIDGLDVFNKICEMTMRYNNSIGAFQGISNINVWKERRLLIRKVHKLATQAATKGVIYSTYTEKDELVEEGTIIRKKDVPVYVDVVMLETDFVIHVESEYDKVKGKKFFAKIVSSKNDKKLKTGTVIDITGKSLW